MADATHISLKVKLDDDIRRFSVLKTINFAELHALIAKHFLLAPKNVQVKYIDDEEELITLGSDLELEEAKRLQPTVLRLNVYDSKPRGHTADQLPTSKLEAAFVRDVTAPDGTNVTARVKFQKSWCVKNTGSTAWPKGVVLKTVDPKDDQLLVFSAGAINRAVGPGEETVVGVDLQAPTRPGRCVQHWRLFTEDGVAFGSRLWVDVTVSPSPQDNATAERELAQAEEARRQAEQAELEQRLKEEEEERLRVEAERRAAEEAEEAERQRLEELERLLAEEEERRKLEEEELRRLEAEELRRKEAEAEEETRRMLEEALVMEERRRKLEEEEEHRRQQEEKERQLAEEKRKLAEEKKKLEEEKKKQEEEQRKLLNSKYPGQLTALAEMGFTDVEHNVKLLDKHKGSLDLALEALLSGH